MDARLGRNPHLEHDRLAALIGASPASASGAFPSPSSTASNCQHPLTDAKILRGIIDLFRTHTADVWYERTCR